MNENRQNRVLMLAWEPIINAAQYRWGSKYARFYHCHIIFKKPKIRFDFRIFKSPIKDLEVLTNMMMFNIETSFKHGALKSCTKLYRRCIIPCTDVVLKPKLAWLMSTPHL